ncbi:unnamed protein product, partial [Phaeothamnion confervicola]
CADGRLCHLRARHHRGEDGISDWGPNRGRLHASLDGRNGLPPGPLASRFDREYSCADDDTRRPAAAHSDAASARLNGFRHFKATTRGSAVAAEVV